MNIADFGPGLWVVCHLPDGRTAIADGSNPAHAPVVAAIRRVHTAGMAAPRDRYPGRPEDYRLVSAWLDALEPLPAGQLFVWLEAA